MFICKQAHTYQLSLKKLSMADCASSMYSLSAESKVKSQGLLAVQTDVTGVLRMQHMVDIHVLPNGYQNRIKHRSVCTMSQTRLH